MKNKTRRGFLGKLDLQMNLAVNRNFGDGACGKGKSGHDQDPKSAGCAGRPGKKGITREHSLLKSWQVQSL